MDLFLRLIGISYEPLKVPDDHPGRGRLSGRLSGRSPRSSPWPPPPPPPPTATLDNDSARRHRRARRIQLTQLFITVLMTGLMLLWFKYSPGVETYAGRAAAVYLGDFMSLLPRVNVGQFRFLALICYAYAIFIRSYSWQIRKDPNWGCLLDLFVIQERCLNSATRLFGKHIEEDSRPQRGFESFLNPIMAARLQKQNRKALLFFNAVVVLLLVLGIGVSGLSELKHLPTDHWSWRPIGTLYFVLWTVSLLSVGVPFAGISVAFLIISNFFRLTFGNMFHQLKDLMAAYHRMNQNPKSSRVEQFQELRQAEAQLKFWLDRFDQLGGLCGAVNLAWRPIFAAHYLIVTSMSALALNLLVFDTNQSTITLVAFVFCLIYSFLSMTVMSISASLVARQVSRVVPLLYGVLASMDPKRLTYNNRENVASLICRLTTTDHEIAHQIGFSVGDVFMLTSQSYVNYISAFVSLFVLLARL